MNFRLTFALIASGLALGGCASIPPPTPVNEKEFEVPVALADKFKVQEESAIPLATPPPSPAPKAAKTKKGKALKTETVKKLAKTVEPWPDRWPMAPFFQTGEKYKFDVTYFGATAGELLMELLPPKMVAERNSYHIRATARTASVFTLFYRMNDVAESFMDAKSLFSHKFTLKLDESMQQRDVLELYDQRNQTVHYWSKLDHKKKGKRQDQSEIPTKPLTQDGLSAFFYLRTLPLNVGDVYEFPVVTNGKLRDVRVEVMRKETINTKIGQLPAIVVKPDVVLDGVLKSYGDSFVWISDDPRRIILKVDAKIKVGSVIAYLKEHSYGSVPTTAAR